MAQSKEKVKEETKRKVSSKALADAFAKAYESARKFAASRQHLRDLQRTGYQVRRLDELTVYYYVEYYDRYKRSFDSEFGIVPIAIDEEVSNDS